MEKAQERSAVWRERLLAQQASGLNIGSWCKQEGVSAWSFYAWRKRLALPRPAAPLIAVPLAGMSQEPVLELQTPGGYVLRLSNAEHVNWLPAILAAVR
jgi:hypothetical protein